VVFHAMTKVSAHVSAPNGSLKATRCRVALLDIENQPDSRRRSQVPRRHTQALQAYVIDLNALAESPVRLSNLPQVAWRDLWNASLNRLSLEIATLKGNRHIETSPGIGNLNKSVIRGVRRAKQRLRTRAYSIRLLSAPPLMYSGIWLKTLRHKEDKVIPVEPMSPGLREREFYAMDDFLSIIRAETTALLAQSRALPGETKREWERGGMDRL
jgi:hypothetical protein